MGDGMKRYTLLASAAFLAVTAGAAAADCAEELAMLTGESAGASADASGGEEISKDGSLAPLEEAGNEGGGTDAAAAAPGASSGMEAEAHDSAAEGEGEIAKDGSTAPLEDEAGSSATVATSPQEIEAQQDANASHDMAHDEDAIARARAALEAGDEEACMEALSEARGT